MAAAHASRLMPPRSCRYIHKAKRVKRKVVKKWCRQILEGLSFLHAKRYAATSCCRALVAASLARPRVVWLAICVGRAASPARPHAMSRAWVLSAIHRTWP